MTDPALRHVQVVDDEYPLPLDLEGNVEDRGATVFHPEASVHGTRRLVADEARTDAVVRDVYGGDVVWPIAVALQARPVRLCFPVSGIR